MPFGRLSASALALGILGACSSDQVFVALPDLPTDIAWFATIATDGQTVLAGSGLEPYPSGTARAVVEGAEPSEILLLGYTQKQIEDAFVGVDATALGSSALRSKDPCDRSMPTAEVVRAFDASGDSVDQVREAPALASELLNEQCPDLDFGVDVVCGDQPTTCAPIAKKTGCKVSVDFDFCLVDSFRAQLADPGFACLEGPTTACEQLDVSPPGGEVTARCTSNDAPCDLTLYTAPARDRFEVEEVQLLDLPPLLDPELLARNIQFAEANHGYLGDVAVSGDVVAVVHRNGQIVEWFGAQSGGIIELLDIESLTSIGSSTQTPMISRLIAHPDGGFLAVQTLGPDQGELLRLDLDGMPIRRQAFTLSESDLPALYPRTLAVDPTRRVIYVVSPGGITSQNTAIRGFDLDSWELVFSLERPDDYFGGLTFDETGVLIAAEDDFDRVLRIDPESGAERGTVSLEPAAGRFSINQAWYHPQSQSTLVVALGRSAGIQVFREGRAQARAAFYEVGAYTTVLTSWEPDPALLLATGISGTGTTDVESHVALFDPVAGTFVLGAQKVGYGVVSRMVPDGRGRYLLALSWAAALARVRPAVTR